MRRCKCEKRPFDILQGMLEGDKITKWILRCNLPRHFIFIQQYLARWYVFLFYFFVKFHKLSPAGILQHFLKINLKINPRIIFFLFPRQMF